MMKIFSAAALLVCAAGPSLYARGENVDPRMLGKKRGKGGKKGGKAAKTKMPSKAPFLVYFENAADDIFFLGGAPSDPLETDPTVGDKVLYASNPVSFDAEHSEPLGVTRGHCDIVQTEPDVRLYCNYQTVIEGGDYDGTLTFEGLAPWFGIEEPALHTITGGSGNWKDARGYVHAYTPSPPFETGPPTFKYEIYLE